MQIKSMVIAHAALLVLGWLGCGRGGAVLPQDGGVDAVRDSGVDATTGPEIGDVHMLDLLPPMEAGHPFNHSTEPSVAAFGDAVMVAYINLGLDSADSFDSSSLFRRVAVAYSEDGGDTFSSALNPGLGDDTSDPVVRVSDDGLFFLSVVDPDEDLVVGKSSDNGHTWTEIARVPGYDKEWIAVSSEQRIVYLSGTAGIWAMDFSGTILHEDQQNPLGLTNGGYADAQGAHFAVGGGRASPLEIMFWDGLSDPVQEGLSLPMGIDEDWNDVSVSIGPTGDGGQWIVRSVQVGDFHQVMLRKRSLPDDEGEDHPVSESGLHGFIPAGASDEQGRIYVVWYETGTAPSGVLKLTRTKSSDFSEGFETPIIIDSEACPGNGWYPSLANPDADDRRLREYVDVAVVGTTAHVVWTHAATAPARVMTVSVRYPW